MEESELRSKVSHCDKEAAIDITVIIRRQERIGLDHVECGQRQPSVDLETQMKRSLFLKDRPRIILEGALENISAVL